MKHKPALQLALALQLPDDETFDSFYPGCNQQLVSDLRSIAGRRGSGFYYIWGHCGSGRTHLLHAICNEMNLAGGTSVFIPLSHALTLGTEVLEGLEQLDLICLDELDVVCSDPIWEEAIFDLFNRAKERECLLIVTASAVPRHLGIQLADLASRLDWGHVYHLADLSDADKLAVLRLRAELRGFALSEEVGQFLLKRLSRDMRALLQTLDKLDDASLHAHRKITIPFVKQILDL